MCICCGAQKSHTYRKTNTQAATKEYARRVPMDMRSTKSFRSKRKAITAGGDRHQHAWMALYTY